MFKVLVIGQMHEQGLALLNARPDIEVRVILDEFDSGFHVHVRDADAIAVRTALLPAAVLDTAERLKIVSRHGVGYDSVDVAALTRRGIPLAITADANAVSVAEHAFFLMLALAKQGFAYDQATRHGNFSFRNSLQAVDLWQKTLLIVGLGRIGRLVAKRAAAFEMRIVAYDPYIDPDVFERYQCERASELEPALRQADVVSLHFPGGAATSNSSMQTSWIVCGHRLFLSMPLAAMYWIRTRCTSVYALSVSMARVWMSSQPSRCRLRTPYYS